MLLPAQRGRAELHAMMFGAGLRRRKPAIRAEPRQRRAVGFAALAGRLEGEMQHPARRLDRRERPGVDLAEHRRPQRMGFEACAFAYGDLSGHPQPVARAPAFDKIAAVRRTLTSPRRRAPPSRAGAGYRAS